MIILWQCCHLYYICCEVFIVIGSKIETSLLSSVISILSLFALRNKKQTLNMKSNVIADLYRFLENTYLIESSELSPS